MHVGCNFLSVDKDIRFSSGGRPKSSSGRIQTDGDDEIKYI